MGETIATQDVVVHDEAMGTDRKLFAGQPVPPDLVDAYTEATGDDAGTTDDPVTPSAASGQVIAKKDTTVYDEAMGTDRKLFAGQPVPPDLVEAYAAEAGDKDAAEAAANADSGDSGDDSKDYDSQGVEDLEAEAKSRGIYESIDGTGANGNVVKADLVAALEADDAS